MLTNRLRGKKIAAVMSNGHVLAIQCEDGSEIRVAWVDGNGNVLKGMPIVEGVGVRLKANGMQEIIDARRGGQIDRRAAGLAIPKLGRG